MSTPATRGPEQAGSSCGVNGCLYGAVGLFALLLIGMLVLAVVRFSNPPEPRLGPQSPAPVGIFAPEGAPSDVPGNVG